LDSYGAEGQISICHYITKLLVLSTKGESDVHGISKPDFLMFVIGPYVAARLIAEDELAKGDEAGPRRRVTMDTAWRILEASTEWGLRVFEDPDETEF
jgi:hypothetical protein